MNENERIDFKRWYRELYRKFTAIRDAMEEPEMDRWYLLDPFNMQELNSLIHHNIHVTDEQIEARCRETSRQINKKFKELFH